MTLFADGRSLVPCHASCAWSMRGRFATSSIVQKLPEAKRKSSVPDGSSRQINALDDFGAMPEHAPHRATLSTNKCGYAGSYQASVESFYHKEHNAASRNRIWICPQNTQNDAETEKATLVFNFCVIVPLRTKDHCPSSAAPFFLVFTMRSNSILGKCPKFTSKPTSQPDAWR